MTTQLPLLLLPLLLCAYSPGQIHAQTSAFPQTIRRADDVGTGHVVHEWVSAEFLWPSESMKADYIQSGKFNPQHNLISGIKTFRDQLFVTVPRLKYVLGVPSTLNQVVFKDGKSVLESFPDWDSQTIGNCSALQCAMAIEIDPVTGYMYVIDPGRTAVFGPAGTKVQPCQAKLVVYDIQKRSLVRMHFLPDDVVPKANNFLNDIVLDRGGPDSRSVRWVYMTDAANGKLYSFDLETNRTRSFYHHTMDADPTQSNITVHGKNYFLNLPIDGLAISNDFHYVYYCALGSKALYQVSTDALRRPDSVNFESKLRYLGEKVSQTGGMIYGQENLYYGALSQNAVYRWPLARDMKRQGVQEDHVVMATQELVVQDYSKLVWPDSFAIDDCGYMWFTACKAQLFLRGGMDWSGASGPNFRIWRIRISEMGYLASPTLGTAAIIGR